MRIFSSHILTAIPKEITIYPFLSNIYIFFVFFRSECFKDLLSLLFSYDWKCDLRVTQAILELIVNLVSTNATYLTPAFQLFMSSFVIDMTNSSSSVATPSGNLTLSFSPFLVSLLLVFCLYLACVFLFVTSYTFLLSFTCL